MSVGGHGLAAAQLIGKATMFQAHPVWRLLVGGCESEFNGPG
jgi:hypothetical protein